MLRQAIFVMMPGPTLAAIVAAEKRVVQSKRNTQDSLRRVRIAYRASIARPATLALSVGAAGLLGFWIARRPLVTSSRDGERVAAKTSAANFARVFIMRYGMQHLPNILRHVWVASQKPAVVASPERSKSSATDQAR